MNDNPYWDQFRYLLSDGNPRPPCPARFPLNAPHLRRVWTMHKDRRTRVGGKRLRSPLCPLKLRRSQESERPGHRRPYHISHILPDHEYRFCRQNACLCLPARMSGFYLFAKEFQGSDRRSHADSRHTLSHCFIEFRGRRVGQALH